MVQRYYFDQTTMPRGADPRDHADKCGSNGPCLEA